MNNRAEIHSLPRLYRVVDLTFSSLRNGVGHNLGVIFDIDTIVTRKCRRVRVESGWKWQVVGILKLYEWDWTAETDQMCLDESNDFESWS